MVLRHILVALLLVGTLFLSGCPVAPDHGAIILRLHDTCCDEISGKGGLVIAFDSRDGEKEGWLTHFRSYAGSPQWRSDGERILYQCDGDVMLMDSDGGNKTTVLDGSGAVSVHFSQDEKSIFYLVSENSSTYEIRSINVDGTDDKGGIVTGVAVSPFDVAPATGRILYGRSTSIPDPVYTGVQKIVYQVFSAAPDGSGEVELCGEHADAVSIGDVSPDGQLAVLFVERQMPPDEPQVNLPYRWAMVVARVDGTGEPVIIIGGMQQGSDGWAQWPRIIADGTRLVYVEGNMLVTVTPQGGDRKEILLSDGSGPSNAWFDPEDQGRIWFAAQSLFALGFTQYASGSASITLDGTDLRREPVGLSHRDLYQPGF